MMYFVLNSVRSWEFNLIYRLGALSHLATSLLISPFEVLSLRNAPTLEGTNALEIPLSLLRLK